MEVDTDGLKGMNVRRNGIRNNRRNLLPFWDVETREELRERGYCFDVEGMRLFVEESKGSFD